jgi:hypothetical protein
MRGRRGSLYLYKYKSIAVIKRSDDFASMTFDIELVNEEREPAMMIDLYNLINQYHDKAYRLKFTSNGQTCRCQRNPKSGELSCEPNNLKIKDFIKLDDQARYFQERMTVRRTKSIANQHNDEKHVDNDDDEELEITPIEVEIEQLQIGDRDAEAEEDGEAKDSVTSDDILKMIRDAERSNRVKSSGSSMMGEIKEKLRQEVKLK